MTYNYNKYSYHYKTLLSLGTPLVVGQVGTIVLGFADTLMVGHHSVTELAAASFVNTIMAIILVFALGYSYGLTPIIGRLYGQGNTEKNGAVVKHGLLAAATTSVILLAVLYLVYINIHRMGQPEELLPLMRPYMIVNMISLPFACWFNTFKQFFDGIGHTKTSMYIMIAGNILNIGGNYLLIYGPGPMPELGLLGAGISTMASRIIMFFAAAAIFLFAKKYKTYSSAMRNSRFSKELYRTIDKQSWPVALQMGMESSAFALTGVMAGWLGTTALATHQIMITISQLFFLMMQGLSFAVSILVSNSFGRKDFKSVQEYARKGYFMTLGISATLSVLLYCFRYQAAGIFTDSPEVSAMAVSLFFLLFAYQFGDGLQLCFANVLRGIQDVRPIMYAAFVSYYLIAIPSAYILGFKTSLGIHGIWLGFPIGLTLAGIFFYTRYRRDLRRLGGKQA